MPSFGKRRIHPGTGFTLIEALISISIFGILAALVFTGLNSGSARAAAKQGAQRLESDFIEAQNNAQSGILFQGAVPPSYGVHFDISDNTAYKIFADANNNGRYDASGPDEVVTKIRLEPRVVIWRICSDISCALMNTYPEADALFPRVGTLAVINFWLTGAIDPIPGSEATIIIKQTQLDICYRVTVQATAGIVNREHITSCPT